MTTDREAPLSFRPSEEDRKILDFLAKRLGVGFSQVVKMGIRRLQELEQGKSRVRGGK